ncbi:hypothetical protein BGX26_012451, partial [Mortierella sp. AD094]
MFLQNQRTETHTKEKQIKLKNSMKKGFEYCSPKVDRESQKIYRVALTSSQARLSRTHYVVRPMVPAFIRSDQSSTIVSSWAITPANNLRAYSTGRATILSRQSYERRRMMNHIEISKKDVLRDIAVTCRKILETLLKNIHPKYNADNDEIEAVEQQRSQIAAGLAYLKTASNLKSILLNYRIDGIAKIQESSLDVNPNILVVRNGVIELATGELRSGLPSDYMSRQLNIEYKGIDSKTGVIEDYISELFDTDQGVIRYLQRMLGYGITGRADSQIWAIFTGEGSNGKSLLVELLECLLEDWVVPAPPEIFFKNPQRVRVGSHSTHLGTLKGARICIKEEAEQNDKLNTEDIKKISAGATITMRAAHASTFEKFKPTVLPILLR